MPLKSLSKIGQIKNENLTQWYETHNLIGLKKRLKKKGLPKKKQPFSMH